MTAAITPSLTGSSTFHRKRALRSLSSRQRRWLRSLLPGRNKDMLCRLRPSPPSKLRQQGLHITTADEAAHIDDLISPVLAHNDRRCTVFAYRMSYPAAAPPRALNDLRFGRSQFPASCGSRLRDCRSSPGIGGIDDTADMRISGHPTSRGR